MDVLRRNTDYALRAMIHLAKHWGKGPVSARQIADDESVSYDLTCKLLQKLAKARLIVSTMGAKGGFGLTREPEKISISDVIVCVQGPVNLNKCLMGGFKCPKGKDCPIYIKLLDLQGYIDHFFDKVTLADLVEDEKEAKKKRRKKTK
jgi:Rrf2 family protein